MKKMALYLRTIAGVQTLVETERFGEAEKVMKDGIAAVRALDGEPTQAATLQLGLALIYHRQGDYAAAERQLTEAIRTVRTSGDDKSPSLLVGMYRVLGDCLVRQNRATEAEAAFHEALNLVRRAGDNHSLALVEPLVGLASAERIQTKYAAAEQTFRRALAILERQTPNAPRRFEVMVQLGGMLDDQHKFTDAEPLLRQGYAGLMAGGAAAAVGQSGIPDPLRSSIAGGAMAAADRWRSRAEAARRLARICETTGRPDEAGRFWDDAWALADSQRIQ
jgi:tetratricopeptide (TPR) repeat protein